MEEQFQDLRQTREWVDYLRQIGWRVERLATSDQRLGQFLYIKKFPLLPFSVAKLQRPKETVDWEEVKKICHKHRALLFYYEPNVAKLRSYELTKLEKQLTELGFRKTKDSYLPKRTIWVDLKKSEKQLLVDMKPKTRYNVGLAQRRGVEVKVYDGDDLLRTNLKGVSLRDEFFELLQKNARRLKIFAMPRKWFEAQVRAFGKNCFVTLAYSGNELIAGNFFMVSENMCFHSHNGSTQLGRKLMAPTLCVWEGILEAKRRKLKIFDFDGIDDGTWMLKRWQGFSRFKRGFGGKEVEFVGQWLKWLWAV